MSENDDKVLECHVSHIGCVEEFSFPLRKGVTVLRGENGSGKTTILAALARAVTDNAPAIVVTKGYTHAGTVKVDKSAIAVAPGGRITRKSAGAVMAMDGTALLRLVDPGIKDPERAERARLEEVGKILRVSIPPSQLYDKAGSTPLPIADAKEDARVLAHAHKRDAFEKAEALRKKIEIDRAGIDEDAAKQPAVDLTEALSRLSAAREAAARARGEADARANAIARQDRIRETRGPRPDVEKARQEVETTAAARDAAVANAATLAATRGERPDIDAASRTLDAATAEVNTKSSQLARAEAEVSRLREALARAEGEVAFLSESKAAAAKAQTDATTRFAAVREAFTAWQTHAETCEKAEKDAALAKQAAGGAVFHLRGVEASADRWDAESKELEQPIQGADAAVVDAAVKHAVACDEWVSLARRQAASLPKLQEIERATKEAVEAEAEGKRLELLATVGISEKVAGILAAASDPMWDFSGDVIQVADPQRGGELMPLRDLSEGTKIRRVLELALSKLEPGATMLLVIPQGAGSELQPKMFKHLGKEAAAAGVYVVTAVATDEPLNIVHYAGEDEPEKPAQVPVQPSLF